MASGELRRCAPLNLAYRFCRPLKNELWYNNCQRRTGMPRLMEKKDWMQTMADVGSADDIWFENVVGDTCTVSLSLPTAGRYKVIFVKLDGVPPVSTSSTSHSSRKISPKVRALRGAARLNDGREYKEILVDALAEKYEALWRRYSSDCRCEGVGCRCDRHTRQGRICQFAREGLGSSRIPKCLCRRSAIKPISNRETEMKGESP